VFRGDSGPGGPDSSSPSDDGPSGDSPGPDGTIPGDSGGSDSGGIDSTTPIDGWPPAVDASAVCAPPASAGGAYLRFNQVGYRNGDPKHLLVMSPSALPAGTTFQVENGLCTTVLTAPVGADLGSWSTAFPHVYDIDVTSIATDGHYTVQVSGGGITVGAVIDVGAGPALYGPLLSNALFFYKAQRDGANVDSSVMNRQPSHLADKSATVYTTPTYATDGSDKLQSGLTPAGGGTVDVSGGWFDAGDYLKFVQTASYTVAVMLMSVRDHASVLSSGGQADFATEAGYGLDWLLRMWNDSSQTLLYQVGIGNGNGGTIVGDHERQWQLPEVDDTLNQSPGSPEYFVQYRPALQAGPAGSKISPNLAGRLAADFGLCSQVFRATNATLADQCLLAGEHVFDLADTSPTQLLTAAPNDYYPETTWRDDLEFGAAELSAAVAGGGSGAAGLPHTDPSFYLSAAAQWANAYITSTDDGADTLNLYDTSALGHVELYKAMKAAGSPSNLPTTEQALLNDLKKQLQVGVTQSMTDPFRCGSAYGTNAPDLTPHALGFAVTAKFYEDLSGDSQFSQFGVQERDYMLGTNGWGTTYIIGAGTVFPHCPHHRVANLAGSLDGTSPILLGAIPDGPNDPALVTSTGLPGGANACPPGGGDPFAYANGHGSAYEDNTASWPTVEPADDYTVLSVLLFANE
jgi:endoglucanase